MSHIGSCKAYTKIFNIQKNITPKIDKFLKKKFLCGKQWCLLSNLFSRYGGDYQDWLEPSCQCPKERLDGLSQQSGMSQNKFRGKNNAKN